MLSYCRSRGTLLLDAVPIEQVQGILLDHTTKRIRARLLYAEDGPTQLRLRAFPPGAPVEIEIRLDDGFNLKAAGVLRFCRTRIKAAHLVYSTVEFQLQQHDGG
jgi:hypothetical protein